ncbi:MAG: primosomal protein N' [Candidatus Eremiobacteraeota bacterium]|nr:primosomal protein N' [Candidatus Eremiobacteraeota bacterium]
MRVVDALPAIRSSRFDLPLTYDAGALDLAVGDVVLAPLGKRDVVAFVISAPREVPASEIRLKRIAERLEVPRAFDETGLNLARFMAERYLCTLGEALTAVTLPDAVPQMRDTLARLAAMPDPKRLPSVPQRLLRCIWEELPQEFALNQLLRHPEARRAADRGALLRHVRTLIRAKALRRERRLVDPRTREYRLRLLEVGERPSRGKKGAALVEFVRANPDVPRADAVLAGFSNAVIARAIATGALKERYDRPASRQRSGASGEALPAPTVEQRRAIGSIVSALEARKFRALLLYGITGSGKTLVYIKAIEAALRQGRRAIVLVPEISLTPQTSDRFVRSFGERVAILHSALSERERFETWQACARGEIDVIVGARSALFAPLRNVGIVILDEAHDPSYKQDGVPRYQAATVAAQRMRSENGVLVLGSATPSLEAFAAARGGRIELLELRERPTAQVLPEVRIVDLRRESGPRKPAVFSGALIHALGVRLERGEKSVLFVNRRGSAGSLLCRQCGATPQCPRCSIALAVHRGERLLRCHYCDFQMPLMKCCESCGADSITELGVGTERVVEEVRRLFPDALVLRMDSDTTTRIGDHARILQEFERNGDVLVGTQMVAKGLDYPTVTLAAVIAADLGFNLPDFRAAERSFALIAQVCGRSGRGRRGDAIVQTYAPQHPVIQFAAAHDYAGFAQAELQDRVASGFPPASRLLYLGIIGRNRQSVVRDAVRYAGLLRNVESLEVFGPVPYPIVRMNDEWRYRIVLRTRQPAALRALIRERILPLARATRTTRLAINVDP